MRQPVALVLGPHLEAVSGVSTHLNMLLASPLRQDFQLVHFQVGSEGRREGPLGRALRLVTSPFRLALAAKWAERMGAVGIHFNASRGNLFHAAAARAGYCLRKPSGSLVIDRRTGEILESRQCGPLGTRDAYFVMGDFDFF